MPRLPDLDPDALPPEARRVHDAIVSGPRGVVQGPLAIWLASPVLADAAQKLGAFCRFGTSLPARLSELAILVVGAQWRASFEWFMHAPMGIEGGLDPADVEIMRTGGMPDFAQPDEAAVHAFASELVRTHRVSAPVYARAVELLGQTAVVELVGIIGYYGLVSATLNVFEVALPAGAADPFA